MVRFKQFSGSGPDLEHAVNEWLRIYEPDIAEMAQTQVNGEVVISFLFDESFRGQELRLEEEKHLTEAVTPVAPEAELPEKPLVVPTLPGEIPPTSP